MENLTRMVEDYCNRKILMAPLKTNMKIMQPTNKSGIIDDHRIVRKPAIITPAFTRISVEVNIMLALMCGSLLCCLRRIPKLSRLPAIAITEIPIMSV